MKLYATIRSERGGKEATKGGDERLEVDFTHARNIVGRIILEDEGGNNWRLTYERPGGQSWTIDHLLNPTAKSLSGEKQKGK